MICPNCGQEVDQNNSVCPFCNEPLRDMEGSDFYSSFEMKETINQEPNKGNKAYIPKKPTEGLGLKIAVGIVCLIFVGFLILYFSSNHLYCQNDRGGKFFIFYTRSRIIYCFQSGQGPGDCKALKSVSQEDLEKLGYNDYESFIDATRVQIESTGLGKCQ